MIGVPLIFCVICREPVPAERVIRGAVTCDKQHARMKKQQMREYRASKSCQTCGRPARKPRIKSDVVSGQASACITPALGAETLEVVHG